MAIPLLKQKKKQKYFVLAFGMLILVTALVVWYGFLRKSETASPEEITYQPPEEVRINFDVLDNPFLRGALPYERIKPFEATRVPGEEIGRDNPFIDYKIEY